MEGHNEIPTGAGGVNAFAYGRRGLLDHPTIVPLADVLPEELHHEPRPHADDLPWLVATPVWRWTVAVEGICTRVSTTATDRRRDALLSATRFIEAAKRIVRFEPNRVDALIAHEPDGSTALPNAVNGRYTLQLEMRDVDAPTVVRVYDKLTREAWTIGRLSRTRFAFEPHRSNPVPSFGQYVADATGTIGAPRRA
ncbi:MAG: hypothetical protein HOQ11_18120 [Gemmatimonadaceae bacterium]|nr:hypothetical protein [Gemmatimonadaceae bacterium]NUQ94866.1 hypothetical protein [Gemmatimonadaceae bacterium]NUR21194.1 hypothetical protein [Gemmatimonadaceae bacterium]NUS99323.1 hypothetical protein [Gemmatimonadaceae bacterium]